MRHFENKISKQIKYNLFSRLVVIVLLGGILIMLFAMSFISIAWFSSNQTVSSTGMNLLVSADSFDIMVKRTTEYDRHYFRPYVDPADAGQMRYQIHAAPAEVGEYVKLENAMDATITLGSAPALTYYRPFSQETDEPTDQRYYIVIEQDSVSGQYVACKGDDASKTITLLKEIYTGISTLKTYLNDNGGYSSDIDRTDNSSPAIAFEMINEYKRVEDQTRFFMPGVYGKTEFYIVPQSGEREDGSKYSFNLMVKGLYYDEPDIKAYAVDPNATEEEQALQEQAIRSQNNVLKGHLLFFRNYNGSMYSDLIEYTDDMMTFTYTAVAADWEDDVSGYKVTIYYVWPMTYRELRMGEGEKYENGIMDYVNENEWFFFNDLSVTEEDRDVAYNNCDQIMGDAFDFLALYITIDKN